MTTRNLIKEQEFIWKSDLHNMRLWLECIMARTKEISEDFRGWKKGYKTVSEESDSTNPQSVRLCTMADI